ncbi:OsmC family protein [Nocardia sp. NBC_00511]|uniref:OsmC family protein n=1 Tax=Nocardia sp. NBC_00511 TaxID=2903591 RepID=UPI0030E50D1A
MAEHIYDVDVTWSGNNAEYRSYSRNHEVTADKKPPIPGSADPIIGRGDVTRWNPEQLLVASLAQCHMLWYLHMCVEAGVVVTDYRDHATGIMNNQKFLLVVLRPEVTVTDASMRAAAKQAHAEAAKRCFIANSMNFPVEHEPTIVVAQQDPS